MSRVGKQIIELPKGVEVSFTNGVVTVKGPKGTLTLNILHKINVIVENQTVTVTVDESISDASAFHGLYRSLINNMVIGCFTGYVKKLEMIGVGYRAVVQGDFLDLQLGFSHPTKLPIPKGLTVKIEKNTLIIISGFDKHLVGQFAATIRSKRKPEPYQGKGIRYAGEYVRKKAGKSAAKK